MKVKLAQSIPWRGPERSSSLAPLVAPPRWVSSCLCLEATVLPCCTNHLDESPRLGNTSLSSRHQKSGLLSSSRLGKFARATQEQMRDWHLLMWIWLSFTGYRGAWMKQRKDAWLLQDKIGWGRSDHNLAELWLLISSKEIVNKSLFLETPWLFSSDVLGQKLSFTTCLC